MSATDELRRLLDERGVEWWEGEDERKTHWRSNGLTWEYFNTENGDAWLGFLGACESDISPEQAVEATLGRGECHSDNNPPLLYDDPFRVFRCSECHHKVDLRYNPKPNYCPNCGRKVVDA